MRFRTLDLLAFGRFTDTSLDFSSSPGLHLIYGDNEAGKSTTLRAIEGALFGIDPRSRDAYVHAMPDLRVAFELELTSGERQAFVRRKGNKATLLEADGKTPIDDALLAEKFLCGIDRASFTAMFALDQTRLREGAESLLEAEGDAAASMFDTVVSGRNLRQVLTDLQARAEAVFSPAGRTKPLNRAIAEFKKAKKLQDECGVKPAEWKDSEARIAELQQRVDECADRLRALRAEEARIARALQIAPILASRKERLRELSDLGDVPELGHEPAQRRVGAITARETAQHEIERLSVRVGELEKACAASAVPAALLEWPATERDALEHEVREHTFRMGDRATHDAALRDAEREVAVHLAALGWRQHDAASVGTSRPSGATIATARECLARHAGLESGLQAAAQAHQRAVDQLNVLDATNRRFSAPTFDLREAGKALQRARRAQERAMDATRKAKLAALDLRIEADVAALPSWDGSVEDLRALPVPDIESAGVVAEELRRLQAAYAATEDDIAAAQRRGREVATRRDALNRKGGVPDEAGLARQRAVRDALWQAIRGGERSIVESASEFEAALRASDDLADRLRREADRVAHRAELEAEARGVEAELAALEEKRSALATDVERATLRWRQLFARCGIDADETIGMRAWLGQRAELVRHIDERADLRAEQEAAERDCEQQIASLRQTMDPSLRGSAGPESIHGADHARTLDTIERVLDDLAMRAQTREAADERREAARQKLLEAQADLDAKNRAMASWRAGWEESAQALGLATGLDIVAARASLDALEALFVAVDRAADARRWIEDRDRSERDLSAKVEALATRYLGSIADGESMAARADHLVTTVREAVLREKRRVQLQADLANEREALRVVLERRDRANEEIDALLGAARVDAVDELEPIERAAARAGELQRKIDDQTQQVLHLGGGASLDELTVLVESVESDAGAVRLDEVRAEIEGVEGEREAAATELGKAQSAHDMLESRSAADAAIETESARVRVQEAATRFASYSLAAQLLRRQIERDRADHQGPILQRSCALFAQLTEGAYADIELDDEQDERAKFRCRRADGASVAIADLSDGTRDQLYLALRIASLERRAEHAEPLPLIVDDILVQFDDRRARAALVALSALAQTTQVLFFTHHARLVEIARDVLPDERRVLHDLDAVGRRAAADF